MLANFYKGIIDVIEPAYKATVTSFLCRHNFVLLEISFLKGDFKEGWRYLKELRSLRFAGVDRYKLRLVKLVAKVMLKRSRKLTSSKSLPSINFLLRGKRVF